MYVPMERENLVYKFVYSIGTNFADDFKKSHVQFHHPKFCPGGLTYRYNVLMPKFPANQKFPGIFRDNKPMYYTTYLQ